MRMKEENTKSTNLGAKTHKTLLKGTGTCIYFENTPIPAFDGI